jgi:hypothetical protein
MSHNLLVVQVVFLLHRNEAGVLLASIRILQPLALETNSMLEACIPRWVLGTWLLLLLLLGLLCLPLCLLARRIGS